MKKDFLLIFVLSLVSLIICFNFFTEFGRFSNSNDYLFHFSQARGECFFPEHYAYSCVNYPPLYHFLVSPFAGSELTFFLFNFCFIFVLIPLTLKLVVKNSWIVAFYFAVSTPFNVLYAGVFPQMVVLELFLIYLLVRGFNQKAWGFLLVLLSFFAHQYGFFFMLVVFVFDNFLKYSKGFPALILGSAFFVDRIFDVFLKFPVVFLVIGLRKLVKDKNFFMLGLFLFTFLGSFMHLRVFLFTQMILIIPASSYMVESKPLFKALMVPFLLVYFVFNLVFWVYLSQLNLFL